MKAIFTLVLTAALALGQHASATVGDDKKVITNEAFNESNLTQLRLRVSESYFKFYSKLLRDKSVKVVNREKFIQLIPENLTDKWVKVAKNRFEERCLGHLSDHDIALAAAALRHQQSRKSTETPISDELSADLKNNKPTLGILVCMLQIQMTVTQEQIQSIERTPNRDDSHLADILETNGVASFPNRIVKNAILNELRKSAR